MTKSADVFKSTRTHVTCECTCFICLAITPLQVSRRRCFPFVLDYASRLHSESRKMHEESARLRKENEELRERLRLYTLSGTMQCFNR